MFLMVADTITKGIIQEAMEKKTSHLLGAAASIHENLLQDLTVSFIQMASTIGLANFLSIHIGDTVVRPYLESISK